MDYYISSPFPHPLSTITSFINPPAHPISTDKVPHNPSLVRSITSISSAQFSIYFSIANNFSHSALSSAEPFFVRKTPFFGRRTPFIVRQAGYISIFVPLISKTMSIGQRMFFPRRTSILKIKGKLLQIHQPPPTSTFTMAVSKAGFVHPRTAGRENDWDITWCKFVIGFPNPKTRSPEYNTFRKAMKPKMEQEMIPGFVGSTGDQWAAIQAYPP